jgi:hypothetical protein
MKIAYLMGVEVVMPPNNCKGARGKHEADDKYATV